MVTTQKIRYSDCDPQGIVFNGNYATYWDDAVTDWLEEKGLGGAELGGSGVDLVTARLEIDFKAAVGLGDTLSTTVMVERMGKTSMTVSIESRRSDGTLAVQGSEVLVFVDPKHFRPTQPPAAVVDALTKESGVAQGG